MTHAPVALPGHQDIAAVYARRYIIRKNLEKALAMPLPFDNLSLLRFIA